MKSGTKASLFETESVGILRSEANQRLFVYRKEAGVKCSLPDYSHTRVLKINYFSFLLSTAELYRVWALFWFYARLGDIFGGFKLLVAFSLVTFSTPDS